MQGNRKYFHCTATRVFPRQTHIVRTTCVLTARNIIPAALLQRSTHAYAYVLHTLLDAYELT